MEIYEDLYKIKKVVYQLNVLNYFLIMKQPSALNLTPIAFPDDVEDPAPTRPTILTSWQQKSLCIYLVI